MSEENTKFKLDESNLPRLSKTTQAQRLDSMSDEEIEKAATLRSVATFSPEQVETFTEIRNNTCLFSRH